jgi:hypothetical protein
MDRCVGVVKVGSWQGNWIGRMGKRGGDAKCMATEVFEF